MDDFAALHPSIGTTEQIVQRAYDLIPALRERAPEAERLREPLEATRQDIRQTGVHRIFQPARFGGSESPFRAGVDILAAIGQGCGSTAWVLVQNMTHNLMLAHWPYQAQHDVWGSSPDVLVSGILIPGIGRAQRVAGGYRLSGRWPFVSGVNICDWALFTALVPNAAGVDEDRHFVVPRQDFAILDTWHAVGLRASASNDVVVHDTFIPEHRSITVEDLKGGSVSPGSRHNRAAIYRAPCYAMFGVYIAAAALGNAEAAVAAYIAQARARTARMTGTGLAGLATQHVRVAEAAASVETARLLLYAICDAATAAAEGGVSPTPEERTRWRCQAAFAGKLATSAVNLVWEGGGGANIYDSNPVSRAFRDAHTANRHTTQTWDLNAATHGRVLFGLSLDNPAL
jgi:3-hydroxy-9,10-secoandrosta-1,3,5(10)-triene-9,17-dione monooxygenase